MLAESTPEAMGLPFTTDAYDLNQVTSSVAALNLLVDQIRENSGDDAADNFLASMAKSAEELGGYLEIADGHVVTLL